MQTCDRNQRLIEPRPGSVVSLESATGKNLALAGTVARPTWILKTKRFVGSATVQTMYL
jgi:hypothetical protein